METLETPLDPPLGLGGAGEGGVDDACRIEEGRGYIGEGTGCKL